MKKFLKGAICFFAALFLAWPAAAQDFDRFTFNIGGGFTPPVRFTGDRLNTGWNFNLGGGVNVNSHFGLIGEFGFNQLGIADTALAAAGVSDGDARIYSFTANPIVRFNPGGRFDAYVIGGGGYYRRTVEFTEPTVTTVTAFDPFWGIFVPVAVPAEVIVGSFSQNKGGLNIGGGVTIRLGEDTNTKFFAESRYHHIYTTPVRTNILPVTFGLRW